MQTEIENLVASFRASVTQEQLNHRGIDAGLVKSFEKNVRDHQKRYAVKLDNLRAGDDRDATAAAIDAAEAQITKIADEAVAAAESSCRVEIPAA